MIGSKLNQRRDNKGLKKKTKQNSLEEVTLVITYGAKCRKRKEERTTVRSIAISYKEAWC